MAATLFVGPTSSAMPLWDGPEQLFPDTDGSISRFTNREVRSSDLSFPILIMNGTLKGRPRPVHITRVICSSSSSRALESPLFAIRSRVVLHCSCVLVKPIYDHDDSSRSPIRRSKNSQVVDDQGLDE